MKLTENIAERTVLIIFLVVGFFHNAIVVPWFISRRHTNPIKARPIGMALAHRFVFVPLCVMLLCRLFPASATCGVYVSSIWVVGITGGLGDSIRSFYIYFIYYLKKDMVVYAEEEEQEHSKREKWFLQNRYKFSEKNLTILNVCVVITAVIVAVIVMSASPDYASRTLLEDPLCMAGSLPGFSVFFAALAVVFPVMGSIVSRMKEVKENFLIRQELDNNGKAVFFITTSILISSIPAVRNLYVEHSFMGVDVITAIMDALTTLIVFTYPVYASYSRHYNQLENDATSVVSSNEPAKFDMSRFSTDVLQDAQVCKRFEEFLIKEFSVENLLFWRAHQNFLTLTDPKKQLITAKAIYEDYISEDAPLQVNIGAEVRMEIDQVFSEEIESVEKSVFAEAEKEIVFLMSSDSYMRFFQQEQRFLTQ